jgi:hypothetical protein
MPARPAVATARPNSRRSAALSGANASAATSAAGAPTIALALT